MHADDTICIVGKGCVLPGADNVETFWKNTLCNADLLRAVPVERWDIASHIKGQRSVSDNIYSGLGGFIDNESIARFARNQVLDVKTNHRLMIMTLEAFHQAMVDAKLSVSDPIKADIYLGCMGVDESANFHIFRQELLQLVEQIKDQRPKRWEQAVDSILTYLALEIPGRSFAEVPLDQTFLTSSVIHQMKTRYQLSGEGALIDAACASSLAAIDYAVTRLKQRKCDIAITGGIEGDLSPSTFTLFSSVGAMAKDTCAPFDVKSQGLAQGEGAVVFVLQRLSDALDQRCKIYGLITGTGASSDGRSSSLFSPTVAGQQRAFSQAYLQAGDKIPDYIECHGTGTRVGDSTELTSISGFFKNHKITIGSIKAQIGHTKGAAGAAGLLKSVMAMQYRTIPPSPYFSELTVSSDNIHINTTEKSLGEGIRIGVSSFGFGNINYHLVLDEYVEQENQGLPVDRGEYISEKKETVLLSEVEVSSVDTACYLAEKSLNILPNSIPQTDPRQLLAVIATAEAFREAGVSLTLIDKERVCVIAASCLCLPMAVDFGSRVNYDDLLTKMSTRKLSSAAKKIIRQRQESFVAITEDIGPGILSNVIAGRVCNSFDFRGKSMNVDADFNSFPVALELARSELTSGKADYAVVLFSEEKFDRQKGSVVRGDFYGLLLSTVDEAKSSSISIKALVNDVHCVEKGVETWGI